MPCLLPKPPPTKESPVIQINQEVLHNNLSGYVRKNLENVLNELLDAEADLLCHAKRYERNAERASTRVGTVECEVRAALFAHLPGKLTPSTVGPLIYRLEDPLNDRLTGGHHPLLLVRDFDHVFMTSGVINSLKVLGLKRALPDCL